MANRVVFPPDWWIRAYMDGRATVLFVPMKPQPPKGYLWNADARLFVPDANSTLGIMRHAPFSPGDTLLCKETWVSDGAEGYLYKADYLTPWRDINPVRWRSPVTMPGEAVRIKPTVLSVTAVWMPDRHGVDAENAGILAPHFPYNPLRALQEFRSKWLERYGSWDMWAWRVEVGGQND